MRVNVAISGREVVVSVQDQGGGFDRRAVPDCTADENLDRLSGRGIRLMEHFLDGVSYNAAGNRITLEKQRSA